MGLHRKMSVTDFTGDATVQPEDVRGVIYYGKDGKGVGTGKNIKRTVIYLTDFEPKETIVHPTNILSYGKSRGTLITTNHNSSIYASNQRVNYISKSKDWENIIGVEINGIFFPCILEIDFGMRAFEIGLFRNDKNDDYLYLDCKTNFDYFVVYRVEE